MKAQAGAGYVDLAIVGSEALLRGDLSESALLAYINEVKQYFLDKNIDIPVTTADVYSVLLAHPNILTGPWMLVSLNYYPYWEGKRIGVTGSRASTAGTGGGRRLGRQRDHSLGSGLALRGEPGRRSCAVPPMPAPTPELHLVGAH